jgi:co-chaperonin GroES (HSP10)
VTTTNTSGINPTGYCVLVKQEKTYTDNVGPDGVRRSAGGIVIPEQHLDRADGSVTRGVIVAMSPHAFNYAEWAAERPHPKVGDLVVFKRYGWAPTKGADGDDYWLLQDKDIQATLDREAFERAGKPELSNAAA